jgi:hypothetical protein
VRQINPLELGAIHPGAKFGWIEEKPATVRKHPVRNLVSAAVLVKRASADTAKELAGAVDVEEVRPADRRVR